MRKMTRDCFKRMQDEQKELAGRIEKLGNFIHQDMNDHSSFDERTIVMPQADMLNKYFSLLCRQLDVMAEYNQILLTRIGYAVQQGLEDEKKGD